MVATGDPTRSPEGERSLIPQGRGGRTLAYWALGLAVVPGLAYALFYSDLVGGGWPLYAIRMLLFSPLVMWPVAIALAVLAAVRNSPATYPALALWALRLAVGPVLLYALALASGPAGGVMFPIAIIAALCAWPAATILAIVSLARHNSGRWLALLALAVSVCLYTLGLSLHLQTYISPR